MHSRYLSKLKLFKTFTSVKLLWLIFVQLPLHTIVANKCEAAPSQSEKDLWNPVDYIHTQLKDLEGKPVPIYSFRSYQGEAFVQGRLLMGKVPALVYELQFKNYAPIVTIGVHPTQILSQEDLDLLAIYFEQIFPPAVTEYKKYGYDISVSILSDGSPRDTSKVEISLMGFPNHVMAFISTDENQRLMAFNFLGSLPDSYLGVLAEGDAPPVKISNEFIWSHEIGHAILFRYFSNTGRFGAAIHEGLADYLAWLSLGMRPTDRHAMSEVRGNLTYQEMISELENGGTPHHTGRFVSEFLIRFTKATIKNNLSVFELQKSLREAFKNFGIDHSMFGDQTNFHHFLARLELALPKRFEPVFSAVKVEMEIPDAKLVKIKSPDGRQSSNPVLADHIAIGLSNWDFFPSPGNLIDEKSLNFGQSQGAWKDGKVAKERSNDKLLIDGNGTVWKVFVDLIVRSPGRYDLEFSKMNMETYARVKSVMSVHVDATKGLAVQIETSAEHPDRDIFDGFLAQVHASVYYSLKINGQIDRSSEDKIISQYNGVKKFEPLSRAYIVAQIANMAGSFSPKFIEFLKFLRDHDEFGQVRQMALEILEARGYDTFDSCQQLF